MYDIRTIIEVEHIHGIFPKEQKWGDLRKVSCLYTQENYSEFPPL